MAQTGAHDSKLVYDIAYAKFRESTPVVQWLSYSPLDPRFAGSIPARVDGYFSERKNPDYDFLRKGSKALGPVS